MDEKLTNSYLVLIFRNPCSIYRVKILNLRSSKSHTTSFAKCIAIHVTLECQAVFQKIFSPKVQVNRFIYKFNIRTLLNLACSMEMHLIGTKGTFSHTMYQEFLLIQILGLECQLLSHATY